MFITHSYSISIMLLVAVSTALCQLPDTIVNSEPKDSNVLAGDLPSIIFARSIPYRVVSDIYVPQGKTVKIQRGTIFLFKNFTGLHVQGTLIAEGTEKEPIVFTSENDTCYNKSALAEPAAYDWNGIVIHDAAIGTKLSFCVVCYSVYGINSLTKFVRLEQCRFFGNGRTDFTVEGNVIKVDQVPYNYSLSLNDPTLEGIPLFLINDPNAKIRIALRYGGLAAFSAGLMLGAVYTVNYNDSWSELAKLSSLDNENLASYSSKDWQQAHLKIKTNAQAMILGYSLCILGATGLVLSFRY